MKRKFLWGLGVALAAILIFALGGLPMTQKKAETVDDRVLDFLSGMKNRWRDLNVPEADGAMLYDIVLSHKYTKALEIGTSTGLSGIYIGWALSKTGGKLVTIEIDETRHAQAVLNFKKAGLDGIIDARLADAHDLVETLPGPFDFVFIDADKDWYTNYAKGVIPKVAPGGCIAAHNVYEAHAGEDGRGTARYFSYMKSLPEFDSRIMPGGSGSLSVSYKKK
jgi:caffeoyl-CoA O-methyltransferase